MNAESKRKDGDLNAKQLKVLELGGLLKKEIDTLEDVEAEYKGHLWEAENLKTSRIPTAKARLEDIQIRYNLAVKEAASK